MSLWLTSEELAELTGYKSGKRQKAALERMGIRYVGRAQDGFPLVNRSQFQGSPGQTTSPREPQLRLS